MPGGRPTKYNPEVQLRLIAAADECAREGLTNEVIAKICNVGIATIKVWKREHPEFQSAIQEIKDRRDARVEASLYERATGYSHPETKVFCNKDGVITEHTVTKHYAPDTASMIFWLKNRKPDQWRDVQQHHVTKEEDQPIDMLELAKKVAYCLTQGVDQKVDSVN